ncbi:hypothetical protein ASD28_22285 [Massilia sp. Root133]|nr:hypothetical protein ASD28_22285 [Massilia sp. Root133]KQZ46795.1 hypothetical protein ASD92_23185 [Massilia sp. Root1485]
MEGRRSLHRRLAAAEKGLTEIIFANILLDKQIITSETFTALLLMAVGSTMLTVPVVHPKLHRVRHRGLVNQASS